MSNATQRTWHKQQTRRALERQRAEADAKQRRLHGFKPASTGEMLREITKRGIHR